jgi:hypothetical protein
MGREASSILVKNVLSLAGELKTDQREHDVNALSDHHKDIDW